MNYRVVLLYAVSCTAGCGEDVDRNLKETFPVQGALTVDGAVPEGAVRVTCHDIAGLDTENPSFSWSLTKPDGSFELSTYEEGDGVPQGKYVLTFFWGTWNAMSMSFAGEDKLANRYADPKTSQITFEVDGSGPVDLGTLRLTTK